MALNAIDLDLEITTCIAGTRLTEDEAWEVADRVTEALRAHPGWHSPSKIARWAKTTTAHAHAVLRYLVAHAYVDVNERGAWTTYAAR